MIKSSLRVEKPKAVIVDKVERLTVYEVLVSSTCTTCGDSTMFKILSKCGAQVRKSLEGIDFFVAEGGRAFRTLKSVLDKMFEFQLIDQQQQKDFSSLLLQAKNNMRTDYKVIECAEIEGKEDDLNDLNFNVVREKQHIISLKKHIIRGRNQQIAKDNLFQTMTDDEVLLVCDLAMKFLPRKYLEDQCDWFAKRGIQWHITMVFDRKADYSVDVMENVQKMKPDVKFHVWSDNEGCYKPTEILAYLHQRVSVLDYNFCEPENGKDLCNRTAATIKSAVRRYINQGNDVMTANAMKEGIDTCMRNVMYRVSVGKTKEVRKQTFKVIPSLTSYGNFKFTPEGIRAWTAFQIGEGK